VIDAFASSPLMDSRPSLVPQMLASVPSRKPAGMHDARACRWKSLEYCRSQQQNGVHSHVMFFSNRPPE